MRDCFFTRKTRFSTQTFHTEDVKRRGWALCQITHQTPLFNAEKVILSPSSPTPEKMPLKFAKKSQNLSLDSNLQYASYQSSALTNLIKLYITWPLHTY